MNFKTLKIVLTFIAISGVFTLDVYLPGVTYASQDLNVSPAEINLTFTAFSIVFALSQLIWGPLSDCYGRKPVLFIGLLLAISTTFLCAVVSSYWQLLALRMFQALGVSCFVVLNAIVRDVHDGAIATGWRAYLTAVSGVSIALAPACGSMTVAILGWRGTFILSDLILLISWILIITLYKETGHKRIISIIRILDIYLQLFTKQKTFLLHSIQASLAYSVHFCFVILSPFIVIHEMHYSIGIYSLVMFFYGLSWLFSGIVTSRLSSYFQNVTLILVGSGILLFGAFTLLGFDILTNLNLYFLMFPILIMVLGAMMIRPTAITMSLSSIPQFSGQGAAIINLLQFTVAGTTASIISIYANFAVESITIFAVISVFAIILIQYSLKRDINFGSLQAL